MGEPAARRGLEPPRTARSSLKAGRRTRHGLMLVHYGKSQRARREDAFLAAPGPGGGGRGVRDREGWPAGRTTRAPRAAREEAPAGPARRKVQDPRRLQRAA